MASNAASRDWPSRVARRLPVVLLAEPWALFVKGLCMVSGATTFFGPAPGSISATLPAVWVYCWSATLVLGSAAALYGLLRPNHRRIEIAGLIWLGTAAIVYGGSIAVRFQAGGAVACGIVLGFGMAALFRALGVYVTYEVARRVADSEGM